jgi:hypothetical protein
LVEPYSIATFSADVEGHETAVNDVVIRAQLFDMQDQFIADVIPFDPDTGEPVAQFTFNPGQKIHVSFNWNVMQALPSTYKIQVDVVKVGSIGVC